MTKKIKIWLLIFITLAPISTVSARPVQIFSIDQLKQKADLVLIGRPHFFLDAIITEDKKTKPSPGYRLRLYLR